MIIHDNCRHFRGDIPCKPHKKHGVHCESCTWYLPKSKKILIIKLGALGDVIRTTPLLHKIWKEYPDASVWWLTLSPEIVPSEVDVILKFGPAALLRIQNTGFDTVINLDKDPEACALASMLNVQDTRGFVLRNGKPAPADERAYHKFLTGLFDDENQKNTKSYPEEIFEICGWKFEGEEYILDPPPPLSFRDNIGRKAYYWT